MNTAYDLAEAAILLSKLVVLTRDGKVEWSELRLMTADTATVRYVSTLDGGLEVSVWSSTQSAGFRLFEKASLPTLGQPANFGTPVKGWAPVGPPSARDLIAISIRHEDGSSQGEIYVNLMSLLELARRSADRIEPKVDRVKQYLDKLAV